ncbi:MAG: ABC transporter permease subunit, partial [Actinobacteria bacterium]
GRYRAKEFLITIFNWAMGVPPVVIGLVVALLLWRSGIFGALGLMYTPTAMIIAETIIALPLVIGFTAAAAQSMDEKLKLQIISLGASKIEFYKKVLFETKIPVIAAVVAGYGAVVSEVGAAMMVGGNIAGKTRVLTTAIVLETRTGHFEKAIALSMSLLLLTLIVNIALTRIQQKGGRVWTRTWL